ncbi:hypothetical protein [Streptomyces sp. DT18]
MTGIEHYREAERLLAEARYDRPDGVGYVRPENIAAAQVHATLALVAATALPPGGPGSAARGAWVSAVHEMEAGR